MKSDFSWSDRVEFSGFSYSAGYENIYIPTDLTYREAFVVIGTLMITYSDISIIKHGFNHTIYGNTPPYFVVSDFDFNSILLALETQGVIQLKDTNSVCLTEKGKQILYENVLNEISFFEEKRREHRAYIETVKD